jgi:hypothetical protein
MTTTWQNGSIPPSVLSLERRLLLHVNVTAFLVELERGTRDHEG